MDEGYTYARFKMVEQRDRLHEAGPPVKSRCSPYVDPERRPRLAMPDFIKMSSTMAALLCWIFKAASAAAVAAGESCSGAVNTSASTPSAYACVRAWVQAAWNCSAAAGLKSASLPQSLYLVIQHQ